MGSLRHIALLIAFLCLPMSSWAADSRVSDIESQIKAAYLYKFVTYVDWPPSTFAQADTPITIGIVGADEVAIALSNIKRGNSARAVEVKLLKPGEPVSGVQVLFIGIQENARLKRLLESLRSQPVLTVTDFPGALGSGSVINFVPVDDRIRFEVSVEQAEHSGLKISARLLSVAQKIEARKP